MDTVTHSFIIPELDDLPDEPSTLWTEYEIEVIQHYHLKGARAIHSFLVERGYNRTFEAIRKKIYVMRKEGTI